MAENAQRQSPLRVAWISDFPIEWLPDVPQPLKHLPRAHPATWAMVLAEEFQKRPGLELHIIVLRKGIEADLSYERNGIHFHVLKTRGGMRAPSLFWTDTVLIRRMLHRIQPALVHAWGTERGAAMVASRLPYPYLVTMQGLLNWYSEVVPTTLFERFAAFIERRSLSRARTITTESRFAVKYLGQQHPHLEIIQAEHASNWIFHRVGRQPQLKPLRFLSVGTLGFRKGSDVLLQAFSELSGELEFELVVVGVPNEPFLKPLRNTLNPELWKRTTFKHGLQPLEVAGELAKATMVVLPTRADTSPNAVKEAAVAGVPVVATAVGGIPDYITDGENGLLIPTADARLLIEALRKATQHPLFSQGQVSNRTLDSVRAYLSPSRMAELFAGAYTRVASK